MFRDEWGVVEARRCVWGRGDHEENTSKQAEQRKQVEALQTVEIVFCGCHLPLVILENNKTTTKTKGTLSNRNSSFDHVSRLSGQI